MVNVGIAGVGFMGWMHWLAYQRVEGAGVAAICTRDEKKLAGDWTGIQGNFGPPGEQVDLTGIAGHNNLDDLIADPNVDLVDICLPPDMHVDAAIKAFEAGKHVLCEKPMALTPEGCDQMVEAAAKANRQLLIGHVLVYFPEYVYARKVIDSGQYGKVLGGTFKRVISDPTWLKDFYDPKRVGGPLIDLHVHDAHFIRVLFGMPTAVNTVGRMRGDVVEYNLTNFSFDDPSLVVNATCGVINQQGRGFTHGFEIHLEKATLQYELAVIGGEGKLIVPLTVYEADGSVHEPDLGGGDEVTAFVGEIEETVKSVEANQPSSLLSGSLARDAIVICQRQADSAAQRQTVSVR